MLKTRIIPCLDVKDGRVVKGTNFINLRDAGDPVEIAKIYNDKGADELCFLDISASQENRERSAGGSLRFGFTGRRSVRSRSSGREFHTLQSFWRLPDCQPFHDG